MGPRMENSRIPTPIIPAASTYDAPGKIAPMRINPPPPQKAPRSIPQIIAHLGQHARTGSVLLAILPLQLRQHTKPRHCASSSPTARTHTAPSSIRPCLCVATVLIAQLPTATSHISQHRASSTRASIPAVRTSTSKASEVGLATRSGRPMVNRVMLVSENSLPMRAMRRKN